MTMLRLLIGTAGSGKTWTVLDEAARLAATAPLPGPGHPPVLVIVPEQQAVQIERALLARLKHTGNFPASARLRVASLTRLARLLKQNAGEQGSTLSELGRRLLCWKLLPEGRESKARAGSLAAVIGALSSYGTSPDELDEGIAALTDDATQGRVVPDARFAEKLSGVSEAYRAYQAQCAALGLEFLSPVEEIPALLTSPPWPHFGATHVFIDGFSGFTPPEEHAVAAIAAACDSVTGAILIDPGRADGPLPPDLADWYEPTRGLLAAWERIAGKLNCTIEKQVLRESRRWKAGSSLAAMATHQNSPTSDAGKSGDLAKQGEVVAIAAADIRAEVDSAAAYIQSLVADRVRYREISVIAQQLAPYADLIAARFADANIPVFIDRRRELAHHPAVEYFRCGARLALGLAEPEELHAWLKTGLAPMPEGADATEVVDRLDAYGRDFDLQPWQWLAEKPWTRHVILLPPLDGVSRVTEEQRAAAQEELNLLDGWRRTVTAPIAAATNALVALKKDERKLDAVIYILWRELVETPLNGRLAELDNSLSAEQSTEYVPLGAVLEQIAGLLTEMAHVAGDEVVQPSELAGWLEYGLAALTHVMPPPVLDNVLVTEAERGRNPEVKHTLLLGLSEGVWPASLAEPPLLSDRERAQLNGGGRMLIPGGADEAAARGPYNLLVAATRPSETLYISRPLAAADGRVLRPSPYFEMLEELLGFGKAASASGTSQVVSATDLAALSSLHPADRGLAALAGRLLADSEAGSAVAHAAQGLAWGRTIADRKGEQDNLDPAALFKCDAAGKPAAVRMSASRLEQFAACPFKHYTKYFLGFDDRAPSDFTPALLGSMYHHVFDLAVDRLNAAGYDWLSGDAQQVRDALREVLAEMQDEFSELANRRRAAYILERAQLLCDMHAAALAQMAVEGRTPRFSELRFGPEPGADLPAVKIGVGDTDVLLSGYIDRVDAGPAGATVVDYKLSGRDVKWDMFLAGQQLQLPVYMLALEGAWEGALNPGHAEFQPIEPGWSSKDRASISPKGMPQSGKSKDDGSAAPAGQIEAVLTETRRIIGELAGRMLAGEIAAQPLRQGGGKWVACSSCSFRALCRFDPASGARYRDSLPATSAQLRNRLLGGESFPGSAGGASDIASTGAKDEGAGSG